MNNVLRWSIAVICFALPVAGISAQNQPAVPSDDELRQKIKQRVPCRFEEEIHFTVTEGQAVAVQCAANPHGLKDFVIYPDGQGLIWYAFLESKTAKDYRKVQGSVEQLGHTPCVVIVQWTLQGQALKMGFCVTTDKQKIGQAIERAKRERGKWSMRIKSAELVPPVTITEQERIVGFVRLWSEAKYNFAFFDKLPGLDWDKVLEQYLPRVQQAATAEEYYKILRECMALLHDGHTEVWGPNNDPMDGPPVRLGPVEGKAVVVAVLAAEKIEDAAVRKEYEQAGLKVGEEVVRVDGEPVGQILQKKLFPYICASTPQSLERKAYPRLLNGEAGSKVRLSVRSLEGREREVTLTRGSYRADEPRVGRPDGDLGDGIFYVNLDSFGDAKAVRRFEGHLSKIRQARGLILDVRGNGGGSTEHGATIISHLTDKPLKGSHWKTRMYRPAFRAWGEPEAWFEGDHNPVKPAKDPYLGPVAVLTGPNTYSAAEDFLVVLKAAGRAKLVGQRSGGSTGQPLMIDNLPGGGGARICTKRDTFPDGTDFVGVGVIPDVEVHPTAADLAAGRDAVLQKGIEVVKAAR